MMLLLKSDVDKNDTHFSREMTMTYTMTTPVTRCTRSTGYGKVPREVWDFYYGHVTLGNLKFSCNVIYVR